MLVLSRKTNESIIIDESIEITICRVSGGRVILGLRAPSGVSIVRAELDQQPSKDGKFGSAADPPLDHRVEACVR